MFTLVTNLQYDRVRGKCCHGTPLFLASLFKLSDFVKISKKIDINVKKLYHIHVDETGLNGGYVCHSKEVNMTR